MANAEFARRKLVARPLPHVDGIELLVSLRKPIPSQQHEAPLANINTVVVMEQMLMTFREIHASKPYPENFVREGNIHNHCRHQPCSLELYTENEQCTWTTSATTDVIMPANKGD
jgi:hypothetical protein